MLGGNDSAVARQHAAELLASGCDENVELVVSNRSH
jgi:hypothetical protein